MQATLADRLGLNGPQEKNNSDNTKILADYVRRFQPNTQNTKFQHNTQKYWQTTFISVSTVLVVLIYLADNVTIVCPKKSNWIKKDLIGFDKTSFVISRYRKSGFFARAAERVVGRVGRPTVGFVPNLNVEFWDLIMWVNVAECGFSKSRYTNVNFEIWA